MSDKNDPKKIKALKEKRGTPVTVSVARNPFRQMYENIGGPLGFLAQLCENATDANGDRVDITIDARTKTVMVSDNGHGMGPDGRNAFVSLGTPFKPKNKNPKGRHGTGAKSVFGVAQRIEVYDRSILDGDTSEVVVLCLTEEEHLDRCDRTNTAPFDTRIIPTPDGFPETGVTIAISDFKPRRFPKEELVLERLGEELAPATADTVRVNGKQLPKREILGERIQRHWEHPVLGAIDVDIYIPRSRKADLDRLRMGAMGPVCNFSEFMENIVDPWLRRRIPKCFTNPVVCGTVDVAVFNNYSVNGRKAFDGALYADDKNLLAEFVTFLENQLGPMVAEHTEDHSALSSNERIERALADIQSMFSDAFGPVGGTVVPPPNLPGTGGTRPETWVTLNTRKVDELVVGDTQEIYVLRAKEGCGTFVWDATASGGTINTTKGKRVTYTAGSLPGVYTLKVSDAQDPSLSATITITVVSERTFKLSPASFSLVSGESNQIRAKNTQASSGAENLVWSAEGGRLLPAQGPEVRFTAGIVPGTYQIDCWDSQRKNLRASCMVTVLPFEEGPTEEWWVRIEKKEYRIESAGMKESPEIVMWIPGNSSLHVNWAHASVVRAEGEGRAALRNLLIPQMVLAHIYGTDPDASATTVSTRMGSILSELSAGDKPEQ